ncbi:succinylglutamate desuccinylase/aspartoacylase family protein [Ferrimonas balearica]|uniref:succinylglutamate desuccinylase/aspartoacylase family protein n=1 Tax=Ferrimonas balearica TaxID=44012 RepID=UPI001C993CDA|nr:succinylglutamate desuccinylase/aspartoacylase family protein [Ferrimonas balearica]MBY5921557.1 succinylglutamate desuccinylase/aspartoacylase family protein [Ferrimonas balearica]MBY5995103.1 succinylglutamate desuccinylase/aspartoacylase family protein [Ferrimonas balearica]
MPFHSAPLIQRLMLDDLPAGRHPFRFDVLPNGLGQSWQVPVLVYRGARPGPRVMITAGVHGDELNGVLTAQQLGRELDPEQLAGTVILVPGLNPSGMLARHRDFFPGDPDCSSVNFNRIFPGRAEGNSAERYLHRVWTQLLEGNADYALDLHTQTRGARYPLFVFADYRIPQALAMARALGPDAIQDDPGEPGVLETVWNQQGVPCITIEVGGGSVAEPHTVQRAVAGLHRVLAHLGMTDARATPKGCEPVSVPMEGDVTTTVRAELGGMALPQVALGQPVKEGDLVAIQYDAFGAEARRYYAPVAGWVLSLNDDPLREPGTLLVRLLHHK